MGNPKRLPSDPFCGKLLALLASLFGLTAHACAAGGHHAVEDAALLEPDQCQVETWLERESGERRRRLAHAGPACRVGPVELGLDLNRERTKGTGNVAEMSPQLKWARQLSDAWAFGVVLSTTWQDTEPHRAGSSLVVPLTWQPAAAMLIHVNIGRDFRRGERDSNRAGAAVEWAASSRWSVVAERFREADADYWRAGARYALNPMVSLDLSRTRGLREAGAWWTLGVNWEFDR
jgi:hypothetical protein